MPHRCIAHQHFYRHNAGDLYPPPHAASAAIGGELAYYRTPSGTEIDFIWTRARAAIGIEVKASERWRPEFARALNELHANGVIRRAFGVYLGARPMQDGAVRVLPIAAFLRELAGGRVLATAR